MSMPRETVVLKKKKKNKKQRKIFVKNKQTKEPETTLNCYLRLIFRLCTKRK